MKDRLKPCATPTLATLVLLIAAACHPVARPAAPQSSAPADAVVRLQHDIDGILAAPGMERGYWGVVVRSLASDETVYAMNGRKLMMPASTLKIVTLAAAAERLGWDYSYETRIVADGIVEGDRLDGNLVIVGAGDPSLDRRTLDSWATEIRTRGIAKVTGTVLADARAFSGEALGFGWSWDDLAYYYAAPIAAAQFRENAVEITLRAGPSPGAPAAYELTPAGINGLRVENRMTTGTATAAPEFVARRAPDSPAVVIEGIVPQGSAPIVHSLSIHDPPRYLAAAFTEALLAHGVELGAPPPIDLPANPVADASRASLLVTHRSPPLGTLARRLMEVSQNQYAETLIKTLGAQAGTPTFEGGLKVVEAVLASWGIDADEAILRDGSGLSRYDYITPESFVRVLTHIHRDPAGWTAFLSSLNVAGQSGTIATRLRNTPAAGNLRAKDGSMSGVRALCGVVNTADQEPLAFAILANNFAVPGPTITAAIDAVTARLASWSRR